MALVAESSRALRSEGANLLIAAHFCSRIEAGRTSSSSNKKVRPLSQLSATVNFDGETPRLKSSAGFRTVPIHFH